MPRDYKPSQSRSKPSGKNNAFLTGLLLGVILGIGVSIGVAVMVTGGKSPFVDHKNATPLPETQNSQSSNQPEDNAVFVLFGVSLSAANRFVFFLFFFFVFLVSL